MALHRSRDLAAHVEKLGYHRFWLAEHHNMPGIASAATSVVIGHVAAGTSTIRVGAGGIMLPNHSPLVIAEQFGTLAALFPGRIDLGLGRAPGTDPVTARALRRNLTSDADGFPDDVQELMRYFEDPSPGQKVSAVPGAGLKVPVWILGSSLFGAQLAAEYGLPYAFASHFAPGYLMHACRTYRERFKPSRHQEKPHLMVAANVIVADTDEEAQVLATSLMQMVVNLRTGRPGKMPPPIPGYEQRLGPQEKAILDDVLVCSFVGSKATVRADLDLFLKATGADELIVACNVFDHEARKRSFTLLSELREDAPQE